MNNNVISLLRNNPLAFANRAHMQLHGSRLDNDPYLRLLGYDLEMIVAGDIRKYLCNLPPGFGKSFLMAVTLTAWVLGHNPSARILIVSYGEEPVLIISKKNPSASPSTLVFACLSRNETCEGPASSCRFCHHRWRRRLREVDQWVDHGSAM